MSSKAAKYLLDASVLIEASKRYYAFDLVSTFWKELTSHARMGAVISIDKVKAEIHAKNGSSRKNGGSVWRDYTSCQSVTVPDGHAPVGA